MPQAKRNGVADTLRGSNDGTWPRLNGDGGAGVILLPEDLLEGAGLFTDVDQDGQPDKITVVPVEQPDGRGVYLGRSPDTTFRQNPSALPITDSSYLVNHPLVIADPPPSPGSLTAPSPAPGRPRLKLEPASVGGFPAFTPESPGWLAFGWDQNGRHSQPGPAVSFTGGQGQSYRVTLPADLPEEATGIDVWMAEPGASSATVPGPMRLQATIDRLAYAAPTYDLLGPFRYDRVSGDEGLDSPRRPRLIRVPEPNRYTRPGVYYAAVLAIFRASPFFGNLFDNPSLVAQYTALSPSFGPVEVPVEVQAPGFGGASNLVRDAGNGILRITRPPLPPEATGWMAFVFYQDTEFGLAPGYWTYVARYPGDYLGGPYRPFPVSASSVEFNGWTNEDPLKTPFSIGSPIDEAQFSPGFFYGPTGAPPAPDAAPEAPLAFGASRLAPGKWYVRITDEYRGLETLPSEPAEIEVGEGDLLRIEFDNPKNRIPNATMKEKGADGLPLAYSVTQTNGFAGLEAGELVLGTSGAQTGTTPTVLTASTPVDPSEEWSVFVPLAMENPASGTLTGSVEVVLRQTSAAGTNTDTVLASLSAVGQTLVRAKILPSGSSGSFVWAATTASAQLFYRFSGPTKNATTRISRHVLKGYGWFYRRRVRGAGVSAATNVAPETNVAPGTDIAVEPPPPVVLPPEGQTLPDPDRPSAAGALIETSGYEAGVPSGWAQHTAGGATIATDATAAIVGAAGLRLRKTAGGSLAQAYIDKALPVPTGLAARHDTGNLSKYRISSFSGGYLDMHAIARPLDGGRFAWVRYVQDAERARLTIEEEPTRPGDVTVNLDGANTNVAVVAVQQVETLTVGTAPASPGTVSVTVGGVTRSAIAAGTAREEFELKIGRGPATRGQVTITAGGIALTIRVQATDPPWEVASELAMFAAHRMPGWQAEATGDTVRFTADLPGPRTDPVFDPQTTGTVGTVTVLTQGAAETADDLARKIRETVFEGWTLSGSANQVVFTAIQAGPQSGAASFDPGNTGAAGSFGAPTAGSRDTTGALASRVATAVDGLAAWNATVATNVVTITAAATGAKQNGYYDPGPTGASGSFETLVEGSSGDVFAVLADAVGAETRRKILPGVGGAVWNIDLGVSGADAQDAEGVAQRRAVVNFWGSAGSDAKTLLARFEDVDLTDYPAGLPQIGVVGESSASATWDVHADEMKVTDRGEKHFLDHCYRGLLKNQFYYSGVPDQPVRSDIGVQEYRRAAVPGAQETWAAHVRWDGVPAEAPARPLHLVAVRTDGYEREIGEVVGEISGTGAWQETTLGPFLVPDSGDPDNNYHELALSTRSMSAGEIVIQDLAASVGTVVKRTPLYATSGAHEDTFDISTPYAPNFLSIGRMRRSLAASGEGPPGTSVAFSYKGGAGQPDGTIAWDPAWETDPALVRETDHLKVSAALSGTGALTPEVPAGSPFADYGLLLGRQDWATFLKPDGSELPGGAFFEALEEWEDLSEVIIRPKAGGDFEKTALYAPVKKLPEFTVLLFTPEGRRYLAKRWGLENFVVEDGMERVSLSVKLAGVQTKKTQVRRVVNGRIYAVYEAKVPAGSVVVEERIF